MGDIEKIAGMLRDPNIEKQLAAAIVLGELKARSPEVTQGLVKLLSSGVPPLIRHALEALARIGARRSLDSVFPLLTHQADEVRRAAQATLVSVGEDAVPHIQKRMQSASPEERRALDAALAELGGDDAFALLVAGLGSSDSDAAKAAAIAVRHEVKRADPKQRRSYLGQTEKFLKLADTQQRPGALAAAIKILGYLEDERAAPTLLAYVTDKKQPAAVKSEAIIALRFAAQKLDASIGLGTALLDAAEGGDRVLAQTALHTLGGIAIPAKLMARLAKIAAHTDNDRAELAIGELGRRPGVEPAEALVGILATGERRRAELAAASIGNKDEALAPLAQALLEAKEPDRAWVIRNVLRPNAKKLKPAARKQLLDAALKKLAAGERGWEAPLDIARDADAKGTAEALRDLAQKLARGKNADRARSVLGLLARSEHAGDEDHYRLASLELAQSRLDTSLTARVNDEALKHLGNLAKRGFDVIAALRKDRALELDHLYYVGFHFAEQRSPLGAELLAEVVKKGGRNKVAKMAKNKLALAAHGLPADDG
ncbi:MAG: HEAT repeat domain-containing protein [Polyangiaceae bacterium]